MLKKLRKHKKTTGQTSPDPAAIANHGEPASTLVGSGGRRRVLTKKRLIVLGTVVAVLAASGGAWFLLRDKQPPSPIRTTEGIELKKLDDQALEAEIQKLTFEKKYDSAEQLIKYQNNANAKESKLALASVYINQGKSQEALQVFLDVEKQFGEHWQVAKLIGQQYQQTGDKQKALTYYKKALKLVQETDEVPLRADEVYFLETYIKAIEGGE